MNKQEAYKLARYASETYEIDVDAYWTKTSLRLYMSFIDYLDDNGYEIVKKDEFEELRANCKVHLDISDTDREQLNELQEKRLKKNETTTSIG